MKLAGGILVVLLGVLCVLGQHYIERRRKRRLARYKEHPLPGKISVKGYAPRFSDGVHEFFRADNGFFETAEECDREQRRALEGVQLKWVQYRGPQPVWDGMPGVRSDWAMNNKTITVVVVAGPVWEEAHGKLQ